MATSSAPRQLFTLGDSNGHASFYPYISTLPETVPHFLLPLLDEYASGTERLLEGLRGHNTDVFGSHPGVGGEIKAKEAERVQKQKVKEVYVEKDVWAEVGKEVEAGPSRIKIFQVSTVVSYETILIKLAQPLRSWDDLPRVDDQLQGLRTTFFSEASTSVFDALITS